MSEIDPNVFQEAVTAWLEHCEVQDIVPQQPSLQASEKTDTGFINLRSDDGFLARYSPQRKRILTNL